MLADIYSIVARHKEKEVHMILINHSINNATESSEQTVISSQERFLLNPGVGPCRRLSNRPFCTLKAHSNRERYAN